MSDWYVDGSRPTSGAGTSAGTAFRTLAEAAAVAKSGDIISVGGGVYRETYAPPAGTVTVGDPDDRFVISGGEPLPGLAPCVAGDEAILGPAWSSMWKATIAKTLLPGGEPAAGNLCEDGVQMSIASDRADMSEKTSLTKPDNFHEGEAETSGSNVTGYRLRSVTDSYTKGAARSGDNLFHHRAKRGRVFGPDVQRLRSLSADVGRAVQVPGQQLQRQVRAFQPARRDPRGRMVIRGRWRERHDLRPPERPGEHRRRAHRIRGARAGIADRGRVERQCQ